MKKHLEKKRILVTGGNRGIGKAISSYLAEMGAKVAVQYHRDFVSAESLEKKWPDKISLIQSDLSNVEESALLVKQANDLIGPVDVIVNNAGIALFTDPFDDDVKWISDWQKTLNVNLTSVGIICRDAIRHFIKAKISGRIINISSRAAFRGDTAEYMAYAASKGGVVALTRSIARAYGKNNIMAFNIAPGFVRTDMAQDFFDQYGEEYALNDIALNKLTEPEDIAPFVAFLASGLADHATGGTFDINAASYVH